jgi:hypothetical protein
MRGRLPFWSHIGGLVQRVRTGLEESFSVAYSPRQIAGSFAIGVFITMLPTFGLGLIPVVLLAYRVAWINKVAIFASGIVINPPVKWGVYAASIPIGILLVGPIEGVELSEMSIESGGEVFLRLVVGNLLLAVIAAVVGYGLVYRMVVGYRQRETEVVEEVVETVLDEFDESTGSDETGTADELDEPSTETVSEKSNRTDEPTTD